MIFPAIHTSQLCSLTTKRTKKRNVLLHCRLRGHPKCLRVPCWNDTQVGFNGRQADVQVLSFQQMQSVVVYSLNQDSTMSFKPRLTTISKIRPQPHRYNSVRVHPYAHPQHIKVLNHFIHIQYRYGMQSVVVYSLNHDTTMSFGLHLTPVSQNLAPTCTGISM